MNFDCRERCDYCDEIHDCAELLFPWRFICEACYEERVRPCPTCNDIVIDGAEGQQCAVCTAFWPINELNHVMVACGGQPLDLQQLELNQLCNEAEEMGKL